LRKYEVLFILNPDFTEDELKTIFAEISDILSKHNAEITDTAQWGKKAFAHKIKGKKEGVYYLVEFNSEPDVVAKINREYRLHDKIFRANIMQKTEKKKENIKF